MLSLFLDITVDRNTKGRANNAPKIPAVQTALRHPLCLRRVEARSTAKGGLVGTFQLMKLLFTQWVLVEFKLRDMVGDISVDEIARHPMGSR